MTPELITALMAFAFVSSITPGPNNLMLMSSGANYGFARTIPHMLGVGLGFVLMVALVGLGLMQVFDRFPISYDILKVVSVVYLLFLACKIGFGSAPVSEGSGEGKPFTFLQAALFQWVNPKGWTMALTAITVYSPNRSVDAVIVVALVFGMVNLPSVSAWTVLGQKLRYLLSSEWRLRAFNGVMAILLLASLYPTLFGGAMSG